VVSCYESICRVHIKPTLGRAKLQTLTSDHLRALYRDKPDAALAPRTVNYMHVTLHKALNGAVSDGLVPKNVASAVKSPRPKKPEIHPLAREQARILLEAARREDDRFEALYVVALHCVRAATRTQMGGRESGRRDARREAHALGDAHGLQVRASQKRQRRSVKLSGGP